MCRGCYERPTGTDMGVPQVSRWCIGASKRFRSNDVLSNVGQTNACSVVFRGKQRVREFEITTRSSSSPATSTGEALRVKSYDLVKFIHIYFYIFLFPLAFFFSARFFESLEIKM